MFLQGNFYHKGKKHKLVLTEEALTWTSEVTPDLRRRIEACEIISCWICPRGSPGCAEGECPHSKKKTKLSAAGTGLSVEVSERRERRCCWTPVVYVFFHAAREVVLAWLDALWIVVNGLRERPRKLLVVINPVGGRKKGVFNFEKKVEPLFRRAGVRTTILQTEYKGHGTHLVQEAASSGLLKECDGVVSVGGDGLVSEIVTGLFVLSSLLQGVDPNQFTAELPRTQIRLGIIPSGSTDATCFATHGSSDVTTAALHILMGDKRLVDVASVHTENELHRVVTSLISYGYFGDLLRSSEQLRCLGPPRYLLSGMQQIFRNRSYPVDIRARKNKIAPSSDSKKLNIRSTASCNSVCSVCSQTDDLPPTEGQSEEEWEEVRGCFSVVSAAITSCSCRLSPQGVSPSAHLGDGFCDLILVEGSSRVKLLSYLYHTSVTGNADGLDHVKMIRTNEIHFSAPPDVTSTFNCDGEEFESSSISIKIHRKKLELFCRGVEDPFPVSNTKLFKTSTSF